VLNLIPLDLRETRFRIEKLPKISSATERKSKILDLYEELVAIQFELKTTNLAAYKSSFNLIKNLHQNCSNADKMAILIAENEIITSLPSSPAPNNITRVDEALNGVPMSINKPVVLLIRL